MSSYTVRSGILAIAAKAGELWTKDKVKIITSKFTTTFEEPDCLIHPNRLIDSDTDEAKVQNAYAILGYFGFSKGEWVLLVPMEDVWVENNGTASRMTPQ